MSELAYTILLSLLQPGNNGIKNTHYPFTLHNIQLFTPLFPYNKSYAPTANFIHVEFSSLIFTIKKSGNKGDYIGEGHTGQPTSTPGGGLVQ